MRYLRYIELFTEESKVINLVAGVFQTITALNLSYIVDASTFEHNAADGEVTIKRKCRLKTSGTINLVNTDEETPDVEIWLALNGVNQFQVYRGSNYQRNISEQIITVIADDVLTLEIMSPETIELETSGKSSFILRV